MRYATHSGTIGRMQYNELRQTSHRLRLIAEAAQDIDREELLDSFDETLEGLTGPQKRSARILADMTTWLLRIESGTAPSAPKTERTAAAKK